IFSRIKSALKLCHAVTIYLPGRGCGSFLSRVLAANYSQTVSETVGSPSLRGIDEFVRGEKREEKQNKGLFFVEPEKNTNVRNRRTKPCQISIPKATEKREP